MVRMVYSYSSIWSFLLADSVTLQLQSFGLSISKSMESRVYYHDERSREKAMESSSPGAKDKGRICIEHMIENQIQTDMLDSINVLTGIVTPDSLSRRLLGTAQRWCTQSRIA